MREMATQAVRRIRPAAGMAWLFALLIGLSLPGLSLPGAAVRAADEKADADAQLRATIKELEQELEKARAERAEREAAAAASRKQLEPLEKKAASARRAAEAAAELHRLLQAELDAAEQQHKSVQKRVDDAERQVAQLSSALKLARQSVGEELVKAWTKTAPENKEDLLSIQKQVQGLLDETIPATVGLIVGQARGSGVIISPDGYVLTAGHVSSTPGRTVQVILHDGRVVRGKTLGRNTGIDSGLIKIESGDDWHHVPVGKSADVKQGDWALAIGHPGGYQRGRPPVVRIGRVINANDRVIWTDCTLVGGDSGGPLFNMDGEVIGIHSRISTATTSNYHVPIDTYTDTWDRLTRGEDWNDRVPVVGAIVGFHGEDTGGKGVRITSVAESMPGETAGLKVGDVITRFDNRDVKASSDIIGRLHRRKPGDQIKMTVTRGDQTVEMDVTLAAAPGAMAGPFLGISANDHEKGAQIQRVVPGTPAASAKMRDDDVITSINGQSIEKMSQLQSMIGKMNAGDEVDVEVLRDGKTIKLKLKLGMRG